MITLPGQPSIATHHPEILRREVAFSWDNLPRSILVSAICALVLYLPYNAQRYLPVFVSMWVALAMVHAHGLWLARRWAKTRDSNQNWDAKTWGRTFALGTFIALSIWGVGLAFILYQSDGPYRTMTLVAVCLLTVSTIPTHAAFFPALVCAIIPAIFPTTLVVFLHGGAGNNVLGLTLVLLAGLCLSAGFNMRQTIRKAVYLAIRNEHLIHELNASQTRRAKFFADANHDLRQPIHAIGLLIGELRRSTTESDRNECFNRIEASIEGMQDLVDYLLDSAKLEAGAVQPKVEHVPLGRILHRVATHFKPIANAKGVSLRVRDTKAIVATDAALLEQILRNLVANAIAYTPRGRVLVAARKRANVLQLSVWDQGIGIPKEKIESIFEAFVRLSGVSTSGQHVGLGLSIVKQCAELLNHPLNVESRPNRGSKFTVSMPYVGEEQTRAYTAQPREAMTAGAFVAVVDDDDDIVYAMRKLLTGMDCHVASGRSGDEIMCALAQHIRQPDLLICDLDLGPEETGLEVIHRIRSDQEADIPALLVSGSQAKLNALEINERNTLRMLKPVPAAVLKREIAASLETSKAREIAAGA